MEMLKCKSVIVLAILVMGVSYLTALDNVEASHNASGRKEIISQRN